MTSRSYCFTLNNWTTDDEIILNNLTKTCGHSADKPKARYIIWGQEVGESGTPHLQGYCELSSPQRISWLKKLIPRAHFESRKGTREQARDYCKKDGKWEEHGEWKAGGQGARNDIHSLVKSVKEGKSFMDIVEEQPLTIAKHLKFYDRLVAHVEKEETKTFRKVQTHILIGEAGTGKSRIAREMDENAFSVNPEDTFPFDGYNGEKTIIIDDFSGQIKYKHLLRILDGHQLRINVKGSHRYAKWNKVFITTNEPAQEWYTVGLTPALKRRLTTVTLFGHEEAGNTMPPLDSNETIELNI